MSSDSLKSLLLRREMVDPRHIDRAVALERAGEATWLEHLMLERVVDEERFAAWVSRETMVPRAAVPRLARIAPDVIQHIPPELAAEYRVVPVLIDTDGYLQLAMVDPVDEAAVEEARFFAGVRIMRVVAVASVIARALHQYYGLRTRLWPRGTGPIPVVPQP
jgi:hypothetical protein